MSILKPKIAVFYDTNGCCFWRSWLAHQELQHSGLADVRFIELKNTSAVELSESMQWADCIQMAGLMDMKGLELVYKCHNLGLKIAVDYDDLHFNCSPWNPKYRQFGIEEVEYTDPETKETKWLWKDGKDGFDIKANKFKFNTFQKALRDVDVVTTTTLYLSQALHEIEPEANIRVMPNAIDFEQWKPLDVRDKFQDKFRFGWAVSGSHGEDWVMIRPVLLEFLKSHPDAKFVAIGDTYMDVKKGLNEVREQIEWYPWSDLWEGHYQLRMPMLGLDAGIAPLADTEFNRCKSPLKWEEYTAFGWPTIAQNMEPYSSHIQQGQTGLLCSTKEEWLLALNQLYADVGLRKKLRFNALLAVKSLFDVKEVAKDWHEMYLQILQGEKVNVGN